MTRNISSAGGLRDMQDLPLTRVVALVNIAMLGPAVWELERDWLTPIAPLEVVILSAIVLAALVAVDHLRRFVLPQ